MPDQPSKARPPSFAVLALATGATLLLARSAVLLAMDVLAVGRSQDEALRRLADALPQESLVAAAAGLLSSLVLMATRGRGSALGAVGVLLSTAAGACALSGWPLADESRYPGLNSSLGRQAVTTLVLSALVLSLVLVLLHRRWRAGAPRRIAPFALGVLLMVPVGARVLFTSTDQQMTVRSVLVDLLDEGGWQVVDEHPQSPVHAGVLTPSTDWRTDGSDRPALVMTPRAEVQLRIPEGIGGATLPLAAGVDERLFDVLPPDARLELRFEVLLDERSVFDDVVVVERDEHRAGTAWLPVASGGLPVRGGELLTLRTHPPGSEAEWLRGRDLPLTGFSGLHLESTTTSPRQEATSSRPNIVFIVMDTLRADRTSAYGYARPTTPHLERLAQRGVLFEQAHAAASYTWPSTGSLLTGLLPEQHGVLSDDSCHLAQNLDTLAEVLQKAGYTTAAYSGNPLIVPGKGFDQGFEFFDWGRSTFRKSNQFLPSALEWLEHYAKHRFFLYLQLVEPHDPLKPSAEALRQFAPDLPQGFSTKALASCTTPLLAGASLDELVSEEDRRWIGDQYDASVATGDAWLGRILDALDELDIADETLVVFTSDHGEELFEHGHAGHGQSLFSELVRVPLVIAGPGVAAGQRIATPVSNRHLAPTLALAGGTRLDVQDALDLRRTDALEQRPVYFSTHHGWWNGEFRTPLYGVLDRDMVLHWAPEQNDRRLFDLAADRKERHDLSRTRPDDAARLGDWLAARLAELERLRTAPEVGAGEATRQMLEEVGYLDREDE